MEVEIIKAGGFGYVDTGDKSSDVIVLLHGLFGGLSNFESIISDFQKDYRVLIPVIPIVEQPLRSIGLENLVNHVDEFFEFMKLDQVHLLGNSLGGHIAQLFTLQRPSKILSLTLTGSSGLFENSLGGTFLRRGDYNYIKEKAQMTFYDKSTATKEMIDEVFHAVNDRNYAIRLVGTAKSAIRHNLEKKIVDIKAPTLLIWGKNDTITPPFVAEKFNSLIQNSKLAFIDRCGHAPMMEKPSEFNSLFRDFLAGLKKEKPALV